MRWIPPGERREKRRPEWLPETLSRGEESVVVSVEGANLRIEREGKIPTVGGGGEEGREEGWMKGDASKGNPPVLCNSSQITVRGKKGCLVAVLAKGWSGTKATEEGEAEEGEPVHIMELEKEHVADVTKGPLSSRSNVLS
ncbi:hypothetical protein AMTR_s00023p00240880 [Amborella trichopoda]|uniref:Uncharacterized protein n=1 Tax=Amborella trichopoda TaxID=13333 RepID=W1NIZ5_AMBTC|nr:hypothetical protein AMTR_s00023p00240880 [Amborella trichopoda]